MAAAGAPQADIAELPAAAAADLHAGFGEVLRRRGADVAAWEDARAAARAVALAARAAALGARCARGARVARGGARGRRPAK